MPKENAVVLDNWFPETEQVTLRPDHTSFATGFTGAVETLIPHTTVAGVDKLFACNNGAIYDISGGGALPAASVSSLTNDRWQHNAIGTAGGQFTHMCNGGRHAPTL